MSSKIAILPFLTECLSFEDELNIAFDIEINGTKVKQSAGYKLSDLFENKIENYDTLLIANPDEKDLIIGNLEFEIKQVEKCKKILEEKLNHLKKSEQRIITP